ncbi:MAG: glutamine synthetase III [Christensenellales bacterium]|jgi:glutamine synthetase|nr:glutamine synthetase type III [Clostridiales bacterium]
MIDIQEKYGSLLFNDKVMKERLSSATYKALKNTIDNRIPLTLEVAEDVAKAMKDWAVEKGATHYTHWFQPMTGVTAEKHDSFLRPTSDGKVILDFSGKALVKGEPDASSLPSGGLRATFEARGYTAWDPSSYAFIKDNSLCIPTAFCTYSGDTLDKKTPLLRSMDALNKEALKLLKLFGNEDVTRVDATCGAEQEYFLIDKTMFESRMDLVHCGCTLFGAKPPKGQEMDDHYFGAIKYKVSKFMKDLDNELWKLGIPSITKHNETAPSQHELAPFYSTINLATDQNQLTMEMMKSLAAKHGLSCLLHEKPFAAVNGSGKHDNWSLQTDTGINLFEPGEKPHKNLQFLLLMVAVIKAVDQHQDLLRISAASAGNDLRLGAHEAPPAIISVSLGEDLTGIFDAYCENVKYKRAFATSMNMGTNIIPTIPKDTADRNRTSPFAFTGNKFEFRMLGSSMSIACTNYIINTIVADVFSEFYEELKDKTKNSETFNLAVFDLIVKTYNNHKNIVFNGNNYSEEWKKEAKKRNLLNLPTTVDALSLFAEDKNIRLFEKHGILRKTEVFSRRDILLDNYSKTINIQALTMIEMVKKQILPAVLSYERIPVDLALKKTQIDPHFDVSVEKELITKLTKSTKILHSRTHTLEFNLTQAPPSNSDPLKTAAYFKEKIIPVMEQVRKEADILETLVSKPYWPFPTYADLLYSVK